MVRTSPFHGGNMGSSPVGITNKTSSPLWGVFLLVTVRLEAILPWQCGLAHEKMPLMAFFSAQEAKFPGKQGSVSAPRRADGNE